MFQASPLRLSGLVKVASPATRLAAMPPLSVQSLLLVYLQLRSSDSDSSRPQHHADREPTTLESFSHTIRNYVPSSIPIPTAAPSPPRVSRPVSFGSFLTPATAPTARDRSTSGESYDDTWRRHGSEASSAVGDLTGRSPWQQRGGDRDMPVLNLDDDIPEDTLREEDLQVTRYPGVGTQRKSYGRDGMPLLTASARSQGMYRADDDMGSQNGER